MILFYFLKKSQKYDLRLLIVLLQRLGFEFCFSGQIHFASLSMHKCISNYFKFPWFEIVTLVLWLSLCYLSPIQVLSLNQRPFRLEVLLRQLDLVSIISLSGTAVKRTLYASEYCPCTMNQYSGHLNLVIATTFPFEMLKVLDKG